jgi:uracil-DNA glycosylase family 4
MKPSLCLESGCALAKTGSGYTSIEKGERYESTRLLLVGEAPGENEVRESLPSRPHSQLGSFLSDALRQTNISRGEIAITDVVRCRSPKDWLIGAPWQYNAISHCTTNYLHSVIEELKPKAILAMGDTAFRTLASVPKGKYSQLDYARGYVVHGAGAATGIPVIGTYAPKAIRMGSAHLTPLFHRDLRRAFLLATGKLIEGKHYALDLSTLGLKYQTAPTIEEAWEWARNINPELKLSYDLETPYSSREDEDDLVNSFTNKDIKLAQFTQRRGEAIAIPWRDEFVEVGKNILNKCPRKIGFNCWSFDDGVLAANGIKVGRTDDAMVKFGTFWSDLPKNLQTAAQMCGFPFIWKHMNESDLAFYGCADVDAALCVDDHMDAILSGEEVK